MVRRPGAASRESIVLRVHLARSEDTIGCHNFRGSGGWVEARDAGQHPATLGSPTQKEFSAKHVVLS